MLRRAFIRSESRKRQESEKSQKREAEVPRSVVGGKMTSDTDRDLEEMVFVDSDAIINEISGDMMRKKRKNETHSCIQSEVRSAWEDEHERGKELKHVNVSSVPLWAKLNSERENDEIEKNVGHLLHTAGNLLLKSTSLSANMLEIKKLTDANADDAREGRLQNVEFHPAAEVMLTAGTTHRVNLFQIDGQNNPKIQSVFFEDYPVHTAHFSSDGNEIIVGSDRKNFLFYDMIAGKVINVPKIKGLEGSNMARFEVSPDGKYLAFLGKYGSIHIVSARSKEWITTVKMNGDVQCVSFSNDGSKMFSFGNTGTVFVWDMKTRNCVHIFSDEGCVQGTVVASSPNNQYIACGSQSGIVNIYHQDICLQEKFPKPVKSVMNLTTICNRAKFNCSSEILAILSCENPKAVKLIHLPSIQVFANFPEQMDRQFQVPKCLDFSPNGGYMAIGNQKGHALLYRLNHYSNY